MCIRDRFGCSDTGTTEGDSTTPPVSDNNENTDEQTPARTDLNLALTETPGTFDPHYTSLAVEQTILKQVYEPLIRIVGDGEEFPVLATDYTISEDGLAYTFNIREGVTFQNGDELTASDVVFSFERAKEMCIRDRQYADTLLRRLRRCARQSNRNSCCPHSLLQRKWHFQGPGLVQCVIAIDYSGFDIGQQSTYAGRIDFDPVSYTHLDVYKRQVLLLSQSKNTVSPRPVSPVSRHSLSIIIRNQPLFVNTQKGAGAVIPD